MELPDFFKSLLWSYDFSRVDSEQNKQVIIVNTINYGDLRHWQWIARRYGREVIAKTVAELPAGALRPRARKLSALLFGIDSFNDAPRSAHRAQ